MPKQVEEIRADECRPKPPLLDSRTSLVEHHVVPHICSNVKKIVGTSLPLQLGLRLACLASNDPRRRVKVDRSLRFRVRKWLEEKSVADGKQGHRHCRHQSI
jgi:hypothetical protein